MLILEGFQDSEKERNITLYKVTALTAAQTITSAFFAKGKDSFTVIISYKRDLTAIHKNNDQPKQLENFFSILKTISSFFLSDDLNNVSLIFVRQVFCEGPAQSVKPSPFCC